MLTLLANHPHGGGQTFVDFIKAESRNQLVDGVVHAGAVLVLSALIVCFVLLSRYLGPGRVAVVAGLTTFCVGCAAMMASMVLDGLVVPAIAVRFGRTAEDLRLAQPLVIFCGILIRFLMPIGLLFQAAAMLSWSAVIVRTRGWRLAPGVFGLAAAIFLIISLAFALPTPGEHLLLGGLVLLSTWYLALAGLLWAEEVRGGAATPT
jgi:hypothetical protein